MSGANYDRLIEIVHASAAFELLRGGLAMRLFEKLANQPMTGSALSREIPIRPARLQILVEGLVGVGLLEKDKDGTLSNCGALAEIIARNEMEMFSQLVNFQSAIVSIGQRSFVQSLIADKNEGLTHFSGHGDTLYTRLESDPQLQRVFFDYMQSYTEYVSGALFESIDFSAFRRVLDVGGGGGALASKIAKKMPHGDVTVLDIDFARPTFDQQIARDPATVQPVFHRADMHADAFPGGFDLVVFAHQLVIWSPEQNLSLLRKAYDSLDRNGTVLICSSLTNDEGDGPLMALLDTVYFQSVASGVGRIYSFADYREWLIEAGFDDIAMSRLNTWTPHGIITAVKT